MSVNIGRVDRARGTAAGMRASARTTATEAPRHRRPVKAVQRDHSERPTAIPPARDFISFPDVYDKAWSVESPTRARGRRPGPGDRPFPSTSLAGSGET